MINENSLNITKLSITIKIMNQIKFNNNKETISIKDK